MNTIKHILYVNLLVVSCNAFGMLNMSDPVKPAVNKKHPQIQKILITKRETDSASPIKVNKKRTNKKPALQAKNVLNFTVKFLNKKQHEQFKNYFDEQTKKHYIEKNSSDYENLLKKRSTNPEIQKLLAQAKINSNPRAKKITSSVNTKSMCPQIPLKKLTALKIEQIKEQQEAEHQKQARRNQAKRKSLPATTSRIKIRSTYHPSPKGSPEKRHLHISI